MTKSELIKALEPYDDNWPVVVEQRVKTGPGEGDVYHGYTESVIKSSYGVLVVTTNGRKLTGGW